MTEEIKNTKTGESMMDRPVTRRNFTLSSAGVAVLVSMGALASWGCTEEKVESGEVQVAAVTPTKMIITHRELCSGCGRCESACTLLNDGKVSTTTSRVKVWRNYNFGDRVNSVGGTSGDGIYQSFQYDQDFCKQCKTALCMEKCPVGAIYASESMGTRIVDVDKCIACGTCTYACPWHLPTIDPETRKSTKCIACGRCAEQCPNGAIEFVEWKDIADKLLADAGEPLTAERL